MFHAPLAGPMYLCLFMCVTDNMEVFLTLAERQYIVKYELDGMRTQKDLRIPGLSDSYTLRPRDNICECSHCVFASVWGRQDAHTGKISIEMNDLLLEQCVDYILVSGRISVF